MLEPWVEQSVSLLSCSSFLPVYLHANVGPPTRQLVLQPPPCRLSSLPQLPISAPPTSVNECFFFNSLVVGLPCSLVFWQFWLFLFLNLLLSFFCLCEEAKCLYLHLHLDRLSLYLYIY